jgi:hypothetical protein
MVENYGVRVLDLSKVGYKDDHGSLLIVLHKSSMLNKSFLTMRRKAPTNIKHVVFLGKQQAIGVDGVSDLGDFNQFNNMSLFIDHPTKIRNVDRSIPRKLLPWVHHDGQGRTIAP